MKIKDKIQNALKEKGDLSVKELVDMLHVSKQAIHIAINQLLEQEIISKFGRTPKTIYRLAVDSPAAVVSFETIDSDIQTYLSRNFLLITEIGKMMEGIEGFSHWCKQRNLPLEKTLTEFLKTKEK